MLQISRLLPFLSILLSVGYLNAVQVDSNAIRNKAIYSIEFPDDSRVYLGKEEAVNSISTQEYITATYRVVELNIVTEGNALLRIYYSRPLKAGEAQKALSDTASSLSAPNSFRQPLPSTVQNMVDKASGVAETVTGSTVIKEYPIATHARTIEYRVTSREELLDLYNELKKHWLKEPAYYLNGQIVPQDQANNTEAKPRSLGGTIFRVQE